MTAADYRHALGAGESTPLAGPPAASPWDPELANLMTTHRCAVMEERLIPTLLTDLAGKKNLRAEAAASLPNAPA